MVVMVGNDDAYISGIEIGLLSDRFSNVLDRVGDRQAQPNLQLLRRLIEKHHRDEDRSEHLLWNGQGEQQIRFERFALLLALIAP